jgi:hypothetical protein
VSVKIQGAITALTAYMETLLSGDIDVFFNEWKDPFSAKKNQMVVLPERAVPMPDATVSVKALCLITVVKSTAEKIAPAQTAIVEKIFNGILSGADINGPVMSAKITGAEFFEPAPGTPAIGIIQILIDLITDYLTD